MIALLKSSLPGIITLSPMLNPEIETSSCSSRYFVPEIFIAEMVYSRGVFDVDSSIS
jgi:hypothetical protein